MSIERLDKYDLKFLGGVPVVYHCHHFNLFLDQTIDDALGESGSLLKRIAGRRAAAELLPQLMENARTPVEKLEIAKEAFASMGHGKLRFDVTASGGEAHSTTLHYGLTWREKYGDTVRTNIPMDPFAAGFAASATALAFGLDGEALNSKETKCIAKRDEQCCFRITPDSPPLASLRPVNRATIDLQLNNFDTGEHDEEIARVTEGLNSFLAGVKPDSRGLIEAFGVYITVHLANYYNAISFGALREIRERAPDSCDVLADLLRESGHVCVFNTFGGMLLSPEWEGLVGRPHNDPKQIVLWCLSIARALGFGRWCLESFSLGKEMVLSTPCNYESPYFALREDAKASSNSPEFFFQGAAAAIMHLAHHVDWTSSPTFSHEEYVKLFENDELPWEISQNQSASLGSPCSKVTIRVRD